jgi:hypothetical protein
LDQSVPSKTANFAARYQSYWCSAEHRCPIVVVAIFEGDQRRVGLTSIVLVFGICALVVLSLLTRPKTQFEREQARAEAGNPKWLKVEITTSDKRYEYRQGEPILVVVHFSNTARYMDKVDAADGASRAAATDEVDISNGQKRPLRLTGVICCDSRLIGLDNEPFSPPSSTPLKLVPGSYEI